MRILRFCLALGILLAPASAFADDHRMDLYGGVSGGNGASKLVGYYQALAIAFHGSNPKLNRLSIVNDVSVQFAEHDTGKVSQVVYMVGARYTFSRPPDSNKISAHFTLGTEYSNASGVGGNDGVYAVGVGYEFIPNPQSTKLLDGVGVRMQVDRIVRPGGENKDFWRVSGGLIYRFGQHGEPKR